MRRSWLVAAVVFGGMAAGSARADSIDDAEAKRRGVPVAEVQLEREQAKVADLEKQVADLKSQIAAAKAGGATEADAAADATTKPATAATKPKAAVAKPVAGAAPAHVGEAKADLPKDFKSISTNGDEEVMRWDNGMVVSVEQFRAGVMPYVTRWTVTLKNGVVTNVKSEKLYPNGSGGQ